MGDERVVVTRAALKEAALQPEVVFEPEATPRGGCYVRQLTGAQYDRLRQMAKSFDEKGDVIIDTARLSLLIIAESLRTGPEPEAEPLYTLGDADLAALKDEIPEGYRYRLTLLCNELVGHNSDEKRLAFLRSTGRSNCGASTASTPPSSSSATSGSTPSSAPSKQTSS